MTSINVNNNLDSHLGNGTTLKYIQSKVVVSVCISNLFMSPIIISFSDSISPIHAHIGNLIPRMQSMKVHDLAKCEWSLSTKWKWVESTNKNSGLQ
jgi:hypothetical protein